MFVGFDFFKKSWLVCSFHLSFLCGLLLNEHISYLELIYLQSTYNDYFNCAWIFFFILFAGYPIVNFNISVLDVWMCSILFCFSILNMLFTFVSFKSGLFQLTNSRKLYECALASAVELDTISTSLFCLIWVVAL